MDHRPLIHGLVVALPFVCPEFEPAPADAPVDVRVEEGRAPRDLAEPSLSREAFDVAPGRFLFRGGWRSARFLVEDGRAVTFERNPGCEEARFRHQLLHQVMAALLRQRGDLVLHASSVLSPQGAVVVAGESGAGKSTTVARLTALGWPLCSDDLTVLRPSPDGGLETSPAGARVALDEASAQALALDVSALARHDWQRMKMAVPVPRAAGGRRARVRRLALLRRGDGLRVEPVTGRDKLALILGAAYGPLLAEEVAALTPVFARALAEVEMRAVTRPEGDWTLGAVVEAVAGD